MARTSSTTKRVVLVHKDGRSRTVETPAQRVKAEYDGFREPAPKEIAKPSTSRTAPSAPVA